MSDAETLSHPVFDADNHYYEATDAFTRHLDPAMGSRVIQWCEIDGRRYHVIGGRVSVVGLFLGSFSAALLSNAPGGLGVLEYLFLKAAPELNAADVIAALLVFRLLYLLIPLIFACVVVLIFERKQFLTAVRKRLS